MTGRVFVSYRKGLHLEEARALASALRSRLGAGAVVLDENVETPMSDWAGKISSQDPKKTVVLTLASESWVDMRDAAGARLLTLQDDPLRLELERALSSGATIIPVVLDGANPISVARLPHELWPIFLRPAERFRPETLDSDADRIAGVIRAATAPEPSRVSTGRATMIGFGSAALGVAAALGVMFSGVIGGNQSDGPVATTSIIAPSTPSVDLTELKEAQAARALAEERLGKAKADVSALEGELAQTQAALKEARAAATSADDGAAQALEAAQERAAATEQELGQARAALADARDALETASADLDAAEAARSEAEQRAAAAVKELSETRTALTAALAAAETQAAEFEAQAAELSAADGEAQSAAEARLATLEAELTTAREALEKARSEAREEREALETQVAEAEAAVEQARVDAAARSEGLEAELEALRAAAEDSAQELRDAEEARDAAVARAAEEKEARIAAEANGDASTPPAPGLSPSTVSAEASEETSAAVAEAEARAEAAAAKAAGAADALAKAEGEMTAAQEALATAEARLTSLTQESERLKAVTPQAVFEFTPKDDKARVVRAQDALASLGYEVGAIDGVIGRRTRNALKSFQSRAGLPETGAVDAETLDALIIAEWYLGTIAAPSQAEQEPTPAPLAEDSEPEPIPAGTLEPIEVDRVRSTERAPEPTTTAAPVSSQPRKALTPFRDCRKCPRMTSLPGGSFLMGSPRDEVERVTDEGPRRRVRVKPFAIGIYEVTYGEWNACVADGFCRPIRGGRGVSTRRPVTAVSWEDITGEGVSEKGFIAWLNSKTEGSPYRLPSEAEWEYAARARSTTRFSFGDEVRELEKFAWYGGNSDGKTHRVGAKLPNRWGLFDMHGNVWEWTEDCWHPSYLGAPRDGTPWMTGNRGECDRAVLRGGAFNDEAWSQRSAYRGWSTRERRRGDVGLRIARDL